MSAGLGVPAVVREAHRPVSTVHPAHGSGGVDSNANAADHTMNGAAINGAGIVPELLPSLDQHRQYLDRVRIDPADDPTHIDAGNREDFTMPPGQAEGQHNADHGQATSSSLPPQSMLISPSSAAATGASFLVDPMAAVLAIHQGYGAVAGEPSQPLPFPRDDPPLYVNPKQYHRILKRRAARARREAPTRVRYQSRVLHAQRRNRGEHGRFGPGSTSTSTPASPFTPATTTATTKRGEGGNDGGSRNEATIPPTEDASGAR